MKRIVIIAASLLIGKGLVGYTAAFAAIATRIGVPSFRCSWPVFRAAFLQPRKTINLYTQQGETKYLSSYRIYQAILAGGVALFIACVVAR